MVYNITAKEAYKFLKDNKNILLIDVRTTAELAYVGEPDLFGCKAKLLFCPIYEFPHMELNSEFESSVEAAISDSNYEELYFICRSGVRSNIAAQIFERKGYKCYNISDGFEGEPNKLGHRNTIGGWKFSQLPWRQK